MEYRDEEVSVNLPAFISSMNFEARSSAVSQSKSIRGGLKRKKERLRVSSNAGM